MKFSKNKPYVYQTQMQKDLHELRKEFENIMLLHDVVESYKTKNITEIHLLPKVNNNNS